MFFETHTEANLGDEREGAAAPYGDEGEVERSTAFSDLIEDWAWAGDA